MFRSGKNATNKRTTDYSGGETSTRKEKSTTETKNKRKLVENWHKIDENPCISDFDDSDEDESTSEKFKEFVGKSEESQGRKLGIKGKSFEGEVRKKVVGPEKRIETKKGNPLTREGLIAKMRGNSALPLRWY